MANAKEEHREVGILLVHKAANGAMNTRIPMESSMKTCVFTPAHETGILRAHSIPYASSHDTRLGRESSWPQAPSGVHFFQAAEGQGGFVRPDR